MWAITWFISILCCEKYLLHWLHFMTFLLRVSYYEKLVIHVFLDPVSNLRQWRNHLYAFIVLRNFHLYAFSTFPLENYLKRVFYASYKLSLLVKWKIWYIGLWFAFIILHWHNLKKIKNMHPSCSQNNVKNSLCFCDKITGRTRERFSLIVNSILIYLLYLRLYHTELYLFFVFQITVLCIGILIKAKQ